MRKRRVSNNRTPVMVKTTTDSPPRLIVGLTGPNAAGKGEAARYLVSRGLAYNSLSDIIRDEAARRKLPPTRENLIEIGNDLRRSGGAGILAQRTLEKLSGRDVVDSIRNMSEIEVLRTDLSFILIAVTAPMAIRFARSETRARPGDGTTLSEFAAKEERERSGDPIAQQLHLTVEAADLVADNSGSLQSLHVGLEELLQGKLGPIPATPGLG
jgi:dephospho-CoA kinase